MFLIRTRAPLREITKHRKICLRSIANVIVKSPLTLPDLQTELVKTPLPLFLFRKVLNSNHLNEPAVVDGHTQRFLTFQDIIYSSYSLADSLKDLGLSGSKKGSKNCIAVISPNHLYYFTCFLSISLLGNISSSINPLYSESEIKHQLQSINASAVFVHPACLDKVLNIVSKAKEENEKGSLSTMKVIVMDVEMPVFDTSVLPKLENITLLSSLLYSYSSNKRIKNTLLKYDHDSELLKDFHPENVVTVPFSSGTTGVSKGVLLTHSNLVNNVLQTAQNEKKANILVPLPFFHIYGLVVGLLTCFYKGSKLVFMSNFDLQLYLTNLQHHAIERTFIVPPIVLALAKHPLVDKFNLSSLKYIVSAAAPLGSEIQEMASKRLNVIIKQGWGMTELSPTASTTPDEWCNKIEDIKGTSGYLVAGTEGKIVHPESGQDLASTEEGEILIRGPQVMKGYLNNPDATTAAIRTDGWLHTGDIGCFDEKGRLFIRDRMKELIKYKGFQVPPAELEAIIGTMKEVKDVIVIPVLDDEAGEVPRAYVVKQDNCHKDFCEKDIIDYVHHQVAPHKRLRGGVKFTESIPKSPSGKLLRRIQIQIDRQGDN